MRPVAVLPTESEGASLLAKHPSARGAPATERRGRVHDPEDTSWFEIGRDFEPIFVNHRYTAVEQERMGAKQSIDYLPPNSRVYKVWREHADEHSTGERDR